MINVSQAFKNALLNDQRAYLERVEITLLDGTELILENSDLWGSSFKIEDAVSSDDNFQVGSAIINKASLTINNIYDGFSAYDFDGARVVMRVGLSIDGTPEWVRRGTYTVDEATYNGSLISLSLLDYMAKFDLPYSNSRLVYPATLDEIVRNACSICDVTLNTYSFPHRDYTVAKRPADEATTFREVIAYAAQIAGCYARCNTFGRLELKWYDEGSLETAFQGIDGGTFDARNSDYADLSSVMNTTSGMTAIVNDQRKDDVTYTITGVDWFSFNNKTASNIYVNSNGWVNIGGSAPSSTGPSYTGDLNIFKREGVMFYLYSQISTIGGKKFMKIRYEGYTSDTSTSTVYASNWELFLVDDGRIVINVIHAPSSNTGTSALVCGTQTLSLVLTNGDGSPDTVSLKRISGAWVATNRSYQTGAKADGGTFNPWNVGYAYSSPDFSAMANVHNLYSNYSEKISTDDVVITGIRIIVKTDDDTKEYLAGQEGYVIEIKDNPFITTSTADSIKTWLGTQLIGVRFRKANITHSSDPTIEAGDVAVLWDRYSRSYPFLVTRTVFCVGSAQNTVCGAQTPARNSAARFSAETKNYVALREQIVDEKTDREQALEDLAERLNEKSAMYTSTEEVGGQTVAWYLHDQPTLAESEYVWKMTTEAWAVSTDGGETWNGGMTVDGDVIARIMNTIGINFEWGTGGTLTLGGSNNTNGWLRVLSANGDQIGSWTNQGVTLNKGIITSADGNVYFDMTNGILQCNKMRSANVSSGNTEVDLGVVAVERNNWSPLKIYHTRYPNGGINFLPIGNISATYVYPGSRGRIRIAPNISSENYIDISDATTGYPITIHSSGRSGTYDCSLSLTPNGIEVTELHMLGRDYRSTTFQYMQGESLKVDYLTVTGAKNRSVSTDDYGERLLYSYETPSPLFGDVGEGRIADDGKCYVQIDSIFAETVSLDQYQVFLQKYGDGDCWVSERNAAYFLVEGTSGLSFGWELKAKQKDFDQKRLDRTEVERK